ncbi:hypothetical protein ACOMHN_020686 [Nucella lapillus]
MMAISYECLDSQHNNQLPHNTESDEKTEGGRGGGGAGRKEQKRRPKPRDGTQLCCGVCSDKALGYNFDAITCESCKAFFRRNANKTKPFSCSFDGNCKLDPHTRKFCSGCRLKKCFAIGMKREWILSDDQLAKRRSRLRLRSATGSISNHSEQESPTSSGEISNPCSSVDGSPSPSFQATSTVSPTSHQLKVTCGLYVNVAYGLYVKVACGVYVNVAYGLYVQVACGVYVNVAYGLYVKVACGLYVKVACGLYVNVAYGLYVKVACGLYVNVAYGLYVNVAYGLYVKVACGLYVNVACDAVVQDEPVEEENYSIPLRRDIEENLHMMQKTYNEIFEASYTPDQCRNLREKAASSSDLFNMTDIFIRRLIKFAKCIPEFKALKQEDQIHLLKGGVMEMFVLRSAMAFDMKKGGWKYRTQQQSGSVSEGLVNAESINSNLGSRMYSDHMTFLLGIHQLSSSDRIVLMLLFVIGLMAADRPCVVNKALVSQAQEKFSMWLRAYLESTHTIGEAQTLYPKLMMKLIDVRHLGEASSQLASSLDISRLEPLLVEVFDLKQ